MKLASRKMGRDGELLLVSQDLRRAVSVASIVPTLQALLDNWDQYFDTLNKQYLSLNAGFVAGEFIFDSQACASPLPRAYQWADASAYVNHVQLVRRARGAEIPESFWREPLMYQGGSDDFIGPCDAIAGLDENWGIDFEAEVAVVTSDVAMGVDANNAAKSIRLLMLVNDVSLRNLIPAELAKGFGFYQSKPASSFSPVAVTPDEISDSWRGCKLHLPIHSYLNGELFGRPNAGVDMTFDFAQLISHAAKTRNLCAGTIIGSGTVSNKRKIDGVNDWGETIAEGGDGYSCIAERRMIEIIETGNAITQFMQEGDQVKIEILDAAGRSIFGAINQQISAG